jgi:hypothetical protein
MAMRPSFDEKAAKRWNLAQRCPAGATPAATPGTGSFAEFAMKNRNYLESQSCFREEAEYFFAS